MFLFNVAKIKNKNNTYPNLMSLPCNVLKSTLKSIYLDSGRIETTCEDCIHYRSIDKGDKIEQKNDFEVPL